MIVIDFIVRSLAIVGAFALGAVFTHWLWHRIAHKWYKDQKLPPWVEWLSRVLGGTIFAIIAYWATFGGGGPGLGGAGGWFGGSHPARPDGGKEVIKEKDKDSQKDKEKDKLKDDKKEPPPVVGSDTVRITVLGDAPLRKREGDRFDRQRRYQINDLPGVHTIDEVKKRLATMRSGKPPLRVVEVVLYLDSPNRDRPQVAELVGYVKDLSDNIKLDFYEPGRHAPVE